MSKDIIERLERTTKFKPSDCGGKEHETIVQEAVTLIGTLQEKSDETMALEWRNRYLTARVKHLESVIANHKEDGGLLNLREGLPEEDKASAVNDIVVWLLAYSKAMDFDNADKSDAIKLAEEATKRE